jgi:hypothetical protein
MSAHHETANPFIEGTASGLRPPAAPHVKRYAAYIRALSEM